MSRRQGIYTLRDVEREVRAGTWPWALHARGAGQALIDIDFTRDRAWFNGASASIPSLLTCSRASSKLVPRKDGSLVSFGNNELPYTDRGLLAEGLRTNSLPNAGMSGVTNGVVGSGGVLPTGWVSVSAGLTLGVVGHGVSGGIPYVDLSVSGTTAGTTFILQFSASNSVAAAPGQVWASSVYLALVSGALTNVSTLLVRNTSRTSAGGFVSLSSGPSIASTIGAKLDRHHLVSPLSSDGSVGRVTADVAMGFSNGVNIGPFVLRIGLPQLEQGARASSPILTSGSPATRAADLVSFASTQGQRLDQGTWLIDAEEGPGPVSSNARYLAMFLTGSDHVNIYRSVNNLVTFFVMHNGAGQAALSAGNSVAEGQIFRAACAYAQNDFAARYVGLGSQPNADTAGSLPQGAFQTYVGNFNGGQQCDGYIRRLAYWPTRVPNAALEELAA